MACARARNGKSLTILNALQKYKVTKIIHWKKPEYNYLLREGEGKERRGITDGFECTILPIHKVDRINPVLVTPAEDL